MPDNQLDLGDLPAIKHPYTEYSLAEALGLAVGHRQLCLKPAPTSLEEAREVIREMADVSGFNWITGKAALDVLDAAIDGRDLTNDNRLI